MKKITFVVLFIVIALTSFISSTFGQGLVEVSNGVPNRHGITSFAENPTAETVSSGNWNDITVWKDNKIPVDGDIVLISPDHVVDYTAVSNTRLKVVGIRGSLKFASSINTKMMVGTILVYPEGYLERGTEEHPVTASSEIVFLDETVTDPGSYGNGLIVFGKIRQQGVAKTHRLKLAEEPLKGQDFLMLAGDPVGWKVDDELIVSGTNQFKMYRKCQNCPIEWVEYEIDEVSIKAIEGRRVTLHQPLNYDHLGGRDNTGVVIGMGDVGNMSRTVTMRSENSDGTRAHGMTTERGDEISRYTRIHGMGRTTAARLNTWDNIIGRYPIHAHHLMGPVNPTDSGYQYVIEGNVISDCRKWCGSLHNTHYSLVHQNIFYDAEGSSFVTEQGNERGNVISDNFFIRSGVMRKRPHTPIYGGVRLPFEAKDFAWEASCGWFTGNDNSYIDNVAANCAYAGMMLNARSAGGFGINQPLVPKFRGADIDNPDHWVDYKKVGGWPPPVIQFSGNEVYSSEIGYWISFAGTVGAIEDGLVWHSKQKGGYFLRNQSATLKNLTFINDQSVSNTNDPSRPNIGVDINGTTYQTGAVDMYDIHAEGFNYGIKLPAFIHEHRTPKVGEPLPIMTYLDGGYFRNNINIEEITPRRFSKMTWFNNVTLEIAPGYGSPDNVTFFFEPAWDYTYTNYLSRFVMTNYGGVSGDDFELFFKEQNPDRVMPTRTRGTNGPILNFKQNCPTLGMTNAECMAEHNIATLDRLATCTDESRVGIAGYTCPLSDMQPMNDELAKITGSTPAPIPDPDPIPDPVDPQITEAIEFLKSNGYVISFEGIEQ